MIEGCVFIPYSGQVCFGLVFDHRSFSVKGSDRSFDSWFTPVPRPTTCLDLLDLDLSDSRRSRVFDMIKQMLSMRGCPEPSHCLEQKIGMCKVVFANTTDGDG
jgi:hypothetical protein